MRLCVLAMEFGTWRPGRTGGASGSITFGKGRFFEPRGPGGSRGGNGLPFGDQESMGRDTQGGVVVKAAPAAAFITPKAKLLLESAIVALDAPSVSACR